MGWGFGPESVYYQQQHQREQLVTCHNLEKTMNVKKQPRLLGALILLLGLGIVGCDNSESTDNEDFASLEVQDLYNAVESELQMTSDQQHRFARALQSQDRRNRAPGFLWIVADSLAQTLTDE